MSETLSQGPLSSEEAARGSSRRLIYLPIVHTSQDMGALQQAVARETLKKTGRQGLNRKEAAIEHMWSEIDAVIQALDLDWQRLRLYQDGLPVCGREAEIVHDMARRGSRNHQLLQRLMAKGAVLMGTESGDLLVQEYELAREALGSRSPRSGGVAAARRARSSDLLTRRDQFMAQRINDTLKPGETGILLVGLLHNVAAYLPQDVQVIYPWRRPG
jgi:hypothetical protein